MKKTSITLLLLGIAIFLTLFNFDLSDFFDWELNGRYFVVLVILIITFLIIAFQDRINK